ncbi:uncharacterized protein [Halyomorpha halys]|uniref:uncharacterized protein n=1 Tax=Halyomorpha halys TaxID=286706 RepID=UPI0006D4EBF7|nr:uncharacterized protein LOC106692511 [Halyomorpha halys]
MKYIAAFLLFTVSVCHGLRLPNRSWAKEVTLKDDDTCPSIFSCKDCNNVRVCHPDSDGTLKLLKEYTCPTNRPWCDADSGTCTELEPPRCGQPDDFVCLKNNQYFPHTDCNKFHFCDEKYVAKLFECNPSTLVFNPIKQRCDDPQSTPCGTFNCENSLVKKSKHSQFVDFYAFCNNEATNTAPVVVNICPEMYVLNTTSQLCEPDCTRYSSINIPDADDCHYYYHCNNIVFMPDEQYMKIERKKCPEGQAYDSSVFQCVQNVADACNKKQNIYQM